MRRALFSVGQRVAANQKPVARTLLANPREVVVR